MYSALSAFILASIDPAIWHALYINGPAKAIVLGGVIVALLQLIKYYFPSVGGWWAFAMNIALAVAGMAVTPPDQFWTLATFMSILQAAGLAAGIHGSAKLLSAPAGPTAGVKNAAIAALISLLAIGGLTGCNDFEKTTFQTLAASQALINGAYTAYEARTIPRTADTEAIIQKARAIDKAAVEAMVTYESMKAAKGTQSTLQAQQAIVLAALEQLPAILQSVQAILPTKTEVYPPLKFPTGDVAAQALYELDRPLSQPDMLAKLVF